MDSYLNLAEYVSENGVPKNDRTGTGTKSAHAVTLRHNLLAGFPLLTTKRVSFKNILTEWKWMMMGMTDERFLQENGCTIWAEWADAEHCYRYNRVVGDLGPIYGHQWRNFGASKHPNAAEVFSHYKIGLDNWLATDEGLSIKDIENPGEYLDQVISGLDPSLTRPLLSNEHAGKYYYGYLKDGFDQIAWLLRELKTNPSSRRLIVSGWNPKEANEVALPPCHTLWQMHTAKGTGGLDDTLNISLHQRSADTFLGLPYNIGFYAFTNHFFAMLLGMQVGEVHITGVDCHIYDNHKLQVETQLERLPYNLPKLEWDPEYILLAKNTFKDLDADTPLVEIGRKITKLINSLNIGTDVYLVGYESHPAIKADVAV